MASLNLVERSGSESQEGFGSWLAFGEQSNYITPLTEWDKLWQKKYEFISSGIRQESTPIVPQRVRASRSPIPNIRGRTMVSGSLSVQSHIRDTLSFWKEATMTTKAQAKTSGAMGTETVASEELKASATLTVTAAGALTKTGIGKQPNLSSISDGNCPAKIKITLGGTPAPNDTAKPVRIAVFGIDQNNIPISEVLRLTGDPTDADSDESTAWVVSTKNYYKQVGVHPSYSGVPGFTGLYLGFSLAAGSDDVFEDNGIQIINLANTGTPTLKIETANATILSNFSLQNPILNGNTFYVQKGVIPNSYFGALFNSTTFTFGETCQIDVDILGRNGLARVPITQQNLYGSGQGRAVLPGPADTGDSGLTTEWNFKAVEDNVNPGWEGGILLKESGANEEFFVIPCTDISFVINNNLSHPERYWFNRYHIKPTATEVREVMVNATIDYKTAQGIDFQFIENLPMEAKIIAFAKPYAGRQFKTEIVCPRVQINSTVDPEVSDNGPITQSLDLKCIPTSSIAGDEAKIIVESDQTIASLE